MLELSDFLYCLTEENNYFFKVPSVNKTSFLKSVFICHKHRKNNGTTRFFPAWKLSKISKKYTLVTAKPTRAACSRGKGKYLAGGLIQKGHEDRCEQEQPRWTRAWKSRTISCSLPQAPPSCLAQDDPSLGVETTTAASGPLFLSSSSPGCCVLLARTTPPHSSLFPLPWPEAIPFPVQQTADLCAKKVRLHLPLKEVIMLMLSTPLVSSNPLALLCIPGCCCMCGKDEEFLLPQGAEEADKSSPAKHSILFWGDGKRDELLRRTAIWPSQIVTASPTVIGGHSLGFHRKQRERYQLCHSMIFSNRWSSSPPGTGTGGTDIWAMTLQFSMTTCLSLSVYFQKNLPTLHVPETGSVTLRAYIILSTLTI